MNRAGVEGSMAGLGQTLRTGRPLVGGFSFHDVSVMCMSPLVHRLTGGTQAPTVRRVSLALMVRQLLATPTPWVAPSAVNSEDPT